MQLISSQAGKLIRTDSSSEASGQSGFSTGLQAIDRLLPAGQLALGAIHEVLWEPGNPKPLFFAAVLAMSARAREGSGFRVQGSVQKDEQHVILRGVLRPEGSGHEVERAPVSERTQHPGIPTGNWQLTTGNSSQSAIGNRQSAIPSALPLVWLDPAGEIYPPALWAMGIAPEDVLLLRVRDPREALWAVGQCLACRGVAATIAQVPSLSRIEARRLQLLAQRGGGCGLLLRPHDATSACHAAATRWLVSPARGERTIQRWKIELIGGHGGLLHCPVYLECSRDQANRLRATDRLAHYMPEEAPAKYG